MKQRTLLWHLYASYLLIILLSISVVAWYALHRSVTMHRIQLEHNLHAQATILAEAVRGPDQSILDDNHIARLCHTLGKQLSTRITMLKPDGTVIGDSSGDPARMDNHLDRSEIREAIRGESVAIQRYSHTVQQHMLYIAMPVTIDGQIVLYVRAALPLHIINETIRTIITRILVAAFFVILLAALIALGVSNHLTQPLRIIQAGALRFAKGDFSQKLPESRSEEITALTTSLNAMASQLDDRMKQLFYEKQTREAVFHSMAEGLLAVDAARHIIHINPSAALLLGVDQHKTKGQPIEAGVRNDDIQQLMREAMNTDEPLKREIRGGAQHNLLLVVRGTALRSPQGMRIGALLVMQDVTHIRHLEKIRQEFVANVSHELKTPITSIKGFAETLLDDADADPETHKRFLQIIARQADHLNAIISDLLLLSSVEHLSNQKQIPMEPTPLRHILESAIATCQRKADHKQVSLQLTCEPDISVEVSPHLFEQAAINLIDNAIKYSPDHATVEIAVAPDQNEWRIAVKDHGPGIERQHQTRLFERFYRIDKGRSRNMGGTGLGLAIVKHIATVHEGTVSVISAPAQGSTFILHLPRKVD